MRDSSQTTVETGMHRVIDALGRGSEADGLTPEAARRLHRTTQRLNKTLKAHWRTEQALRASEARLQAIVNTTMEGIISTDEQGFIESVNPAIERLFGYSAEELIGRNVKMLLPPPYCDLPDQAIAAYLRTGRTDLIDVRHESVGRRKEGSTFPIDLTISEVAINGRRTFTGILRDITERQQAEQTARRLAAIVESSDDAIVSKTLDGIITSWNNGAQRLFGYSAEEAIGQSITILIPPDRQAEEPRILARLRQGERIDHYEAVRVRKDGQPIDVSVTISPIRDAAGRIIGASKIARDITAQKQAQRELQAAKNVAEAANQAKDYFLAVLSHELRTPLTPALARLSLLLRKPSLSADVREGLEMVRRNVELEARLIDDLLDLTRIAHGKLQLNLQSVDAHDRLRAALSIYQSEIDAKHLHVGFHLNAHQHHVLADPTRLEQVFWNLISNAVKYTPSGGCIGIHATNDGETLRVEIVDSGIGIEPAVMGRIFNAFEQGEQTLTRRFGGLGLGLSISQTLVQKLGGSLTAASQGRDQGASFTVDLKTVAPPEAVVPISPAPAVGHPQRVLRLLLVEDNPDTLRVLGRLLRSFGHRVETAAGVHEALAAAATEQFDLLISDIGLPDGTGWDLMRTLQQQHPLPGIALSGFALDEDIQKSKGAGFAEHLAKPLDPQVLEATIQQVAYAGARG